jgi:hypothetical protein
VSRFLLVVDAGQPSVVRVEDEDFQSTCDAAHVVADLEGDPVLVLKDRRRRTPYLPDHRTLEMWLRGLGEELLRRR